MNNTSDWFLGYEIATDDAAKRHVESRPLKLITVAWEWQKIYLSNPLQSIGVIPPTSDTLIKEPNHD